MEIPWWTRLEHKWLWIFHICLKPDDSWFSRKTEYECYVLHLASCNGHLLWLVRTATLSDWCWWVDEISQKKVWWNQNCNPSLSLPPALATKLKVLWLWLAAGVAGPQECLSICLRTFANTGIPFPFLKIRCLRIDSNVLIFKARSSESNKI